MPFYSGGKKWTGKYRRELSRGLQYYLLRQNIGLLNWFGNIRLEEEAIPKYAVLAGYGDYWDDLRSDATRANGVLRNKNYRGEAFFIEHRENTVSRAEWKSNVIEIAVDMALPGRLIINQNYNREWYSDRGELYEERGLIGIKFERPITGIVKLSYRPMSLYVGGAVSLLALLACCSYLVFQRLKGKST